MIYPVDSSIQRLNNRGPEGEGGGGSSRSASVWSINKGGGGPLGPSPGSATEKDDFSVSDTGGSEKKDKYSVE